MTQKSKILLLDDDVFHRGLLSEGLEDYFDFDVTKVANLAAAQQALGELKPDLLLLDVVVGDDRFEVLNWVKSLRKSGPFKNVPVLFVTAHFEKIAAHLDGIENAELLKKPFKLGDVIPKIRKLMGRTYK